MNFHEAFLHELRRGRKVLYVAIEERCHVCNRATELRAGTCFECKELIETNLIEVWEISNPENRWPYTWAGKPLEYTEEELAVLQRLAEWADL